MIKPMRGRRCCAVTLMKSRRSWQLTAAVLRKGWTRETEDVCRKRSSGCFWLTPGLLNKKQFANGADEGGSYLKAHW